MASTRTTVRHASRNFPRKRILAPPISICIGEQSAMHLQPPAATAFGESSSLPSLIYGLACRRSRTGLGSVNLIKTDGVLSAGTSRRQNARIAAI